MVGKILKNVTSCAMQQSDAIRQSAHTLQTNCKCCSFADSISNSVYIYNMFNENRYELLYVL
jgi:hypothetical protein